MQPAQSKPESQIQYEFFFVSPQIFTRPDDQNVVEGLNKCPFADTGCTADLMSYEDLQQHLELVYIPHLYETFVLLQLQPDGDQTKDQTTLLRSYLQHFIALMPSDTEASPSLSERIRCDSGFAEDESQYINDHDEGQDGITQSMQQLLQQESFGQSVSGSRDVAEQTTESLFEVETLSASRLVDSPSFRLASIESGINSGHLIWKIEPYSQHKAAATSMLSAPFYSGRYGYKMCLRLYIMGDGIGKGTHLSLFFVVMRGEFDNILQWPFTHKVTFKLINQAGGRDIVDTFQPDPSNSSFRKPKSDMNIASGCPQFITHTELERGGFIVDDTIFIKCTIDNTTIRHP